MRWQHDRVTGYVALLGRINVGGRNVAMARLREIVAELGFTDVGTYIQTGNLFFRASESDPDAVARTLAAHLEETLGYEVPTFVRSVAELRAAAATDPFRGIDADKETRLMVLLMSARLPANIQFPVTDAKKGFSLVGAYGREAFVVLRLVNGRPGNVVGWLEKEFGVTATGRFAHTMAKIVAAAETHLA